VERVQRAVNLAVVIVPLAGLGAVGAVAWGGALQPVDLALLAGTYFLTIVGITVGFHRYLTHHAFATRRPVGYALAVLGSMAGQGAVITWVAGHRRHHAHTDVDGDPHSPHVLPDGTRFREVLRASFRGAARATWHAHAGWLWSGRHDREDRARYAPDLLEDRGYLLIDRLFVPLVGLSLLLPAAAGWANGGGADDALRGLVWGGLVRMVLLLHVTGSVNSLCHLFGSRRFAISDESTNVVWLALPTFGEAWHHNHHAFPRSAAHGLRRGELDPSAWIIRALERVGLAWDVVRIAPDRQTAAEAGAALRARAPVRG
jgi:stearoyl-CoA desaturase (delta-9 desaturase)